MTTHDKIDSSSDEAFFAWTKTQPPRRWAKVNLHDCSIGWHARDDEIERLRARVAELERSIEGLPATNLESVN